MEACGEILVSLFYQSARGVNENKKQSHDTAGFDWGCTFSVQTLILVGQIIYRSSVSTVHDLDLSGQIDR